MFVTKKIDMRRKYPQTLSQDFKNQRTTLERRYNIIPYLILHPNHTNTEKVVNRNTFRPIWIRVL